MKTKIFLVLLSVASFMFLMACNDMDNSKCMQTVCEKFPNAKVFPLPDESWRYIVVQGDSILYVTVKGNYDKITSAVRIK
jgi:hypothetical protein